MVMRLKAAYQYCCKEAGKTDGRILFEFLTGKRISEVLTHPEAECTADFEAALARLKAGEPLQYILGETEFMGLSFYVTPDVLIPRQDTELLVEWAAEQLKATENAKVLDLCTGSGCIAISVQKCTGAHVTGVDISDAALEVARKNAARNGAEVCFLQQDAHTYAALAGLDMVLSNPPYIESAVVETLEDKVKNYEPRLALDGGADGLDFYTDIAKNSKKMLKNGGVLAVEIGYNQGAAVSEIFDKVFGNSTVLQDLCGLDRVVYAYKQVK